MMFGKKRPWKKWAHIKRVETHSGDVKFTAYKTFDTPNIKPDGNTVTILGTYESLTEAEQALDAWWASWWPKQIKSRRRV